MDKRAAVATIAGAGVAAGLAFLFGSEPGRRRRARMRDTSARGWRATSNFLGGASSGIATQARGLAGRAGSVFRRGEGGDPVLEQRIRAAIRSAVSDPDAIHIEVHNGTVTLSGSLSAAEAGALIEAVASVEDVSQVEDRLTVYPTERQGEHIMRKGAWMRTDWPPALRLVTGAAGGGLALYGLSHRRNMLGKAASALGFGLLAQGVTNRGVRRVLMLARRAA
jgi:hypothetical protein